MFDLDEKDLAILEYIEHDFDVTLTTIADRLDLSESAVHYRIDKLKEKNVIKEVTANVDPLALGLDMLVITEVTVIHEPGYAEDIGTQLCEKDGIQQIYYTMGDVDFIIISRVQNRKQMNLLIDKIVSIDGITNTSSTFVMQEFKTDNSVTSEMSDEMRKSVLNNGQTS